MKRILFSLIPVISFFTFSCSSDTIWDIDADQFSARVRHGDIEFLRHIEYSEVDLDEIILLGPGTPLVFSYFYDELGMEGFARDMLRIEWDESFGIWRRFAGERLIDRLIAAREYADAEELSEEYIRYYGEPYFGYRRLCEAMYWQRKDRTVLDMLERLHADFPVEAAADPELMLFHAVSSSRLEIPGWDDLFIQLFRQIPSSGVLIRAYTYINDSDARREYFSEEELSFFNARVLTATDRYSDASEIYAELLKTMSPVISGESTYREIGRVFLISSRLREGAELIINHATGDPHFYSFFSAGRLLRAAGDYDRAVELFSEAGTLAENDSGLSDRALWYSLDCLLKAGPYRFAESVPEYAERWHSGAFFADLFEEAAARMTADREWGKIWELYKQLHTKMDDNTAALYAHILLQAEESGLFLPPYQEGEAGRDELVSDAVAHHLYGYYHLFALPPDGGVPEILLNIGEEQPPVPAGIESEEGKLIRSFLSFSLFRDAYALMERYGKNLSDGELLQFASQLKDAGLFRESISLVNTGMKRESWDMTKESFDVLFPKAYSHTIERTAKRYAVDPWVFTALIREESYFDPAAVSRAGAVGLSQLMPATAEDTARRMGFEAPQLQDPEDNLSIGGYYFGSLLQRFDNNHLYAVCAYNAGPTRMRRWAASYGDLPAPLLIEAIPFKETRNHAKKVLVSSVLYGYLYGDRDPKSTIQFYLSGQSK